jgi:hypothetical protein
MAWETIFKSIVSPWMKFKTDTQQKEMDYRRKNLKIQCDLLHDFHGKPFNAFAYLRTSATLKNQGWRRDKANIVIEWIRNNSHNFPEHIRKEFISILRAANEMIHLYSEWRESLKAADNATITIRSYLDKIERELRGEK